MQGKNKECDLIINFIKDSQHNEVEYWLYRIKYSNKEYEDAIKYLNASYSKFSTDISEILTNSLEESVAKYYKQQIYIDKIEAQYRILLLIVILIFVIIVFVVIAFNLIKKNRQKHKEIEALLVSYNTMAEQLDFYGQQLEDRDESISRLRKEVSLMYKKQFATIGELCFTYLTKRELTKNKETIYKKVEKMVKLVTPDDKLCTLLESKINKELDNILIHLREDISGLNNDDIKFICYCIIGFDANIISIILNISTSNVYTKKSRIKSKINSLSPEKRDMYLSYI